MRTLNTLLVANRGEIALRIAATARRMGIRTVAVYSEADRDAAFVTACDHAVCIGGAAARDSYLNGERIIAAALDCGADAIHPGYGFLSENDAFAQAVEAAGLVFVGPPPAAIAAMGSKSAAKQLMAQAGVPLVPGYHGEAQNDALLQAEADAIGYPVLIKATAGGGGKGMRVVHGSADFAAALQSCRREARNAFADDRVLIERYLERSRHVEVQVFADTHGQVVHLFERDCSVQRRHQKVIEEAPAPGLSAHLRDAMGAAAVAAARAVGYVGAGTVEFILAPDDQFYFMEMNTRLQVEHPVTEMITGLDLVALQLRIAAGEPLPFAQTDLSFHGHAIELRLYAENADQGFLPSMGQLQHVRWPEATAFRVNAHIAGQSVQHAGLPDALRLDAGVRTGDAITGHYDPMIGKLIAWAPDRKRAIARLVNALEMLEVVGVHTNAAFLRRLLRDSAFAQADLDTGLIVRRQPYLQAPSHCPAAVLVLAAASLEKQTQACAIPDSNAAQWIDPWLSLRDWRLSGSVERHYRFRCRGEVYGVTWQVGPDGSAQCAMTGISPAQDGGEARVDSVAVRCMPDGEDGAVCVEMAGEVHQARAIRTDTGLALFVRGDTWVLERVGVERDDAEASTGGGLRAPMPGKVLAVMVQTGDAVKAGQALMVMEAMKMEHTITAPQDGVIQQCLYAVGDTVAEGAALLALE